MIKFKDIDDIFKNVKDLNSKIDSRIDKLNHKFETEFNYLSREIVDNKKSTENDIKSMLQNWQNSEEFRMMLNSIKKKEVDSNDGIHILIINFNTFYNLLLWEIMKIFFMK